MITTAEVKFSQFRIAWVQVDQVVARLQKFQTTISRVHSSPVNSKHTWISGANRFGEKNAGPVGCHGNLHCNCIMPSVFYFIL